MFKLQSVIFITGISILLCSSTSMSKRTENEYHEHQQLNDNVLANLKLKTNSFIEEVGKAGYRRFNDISPLKDNPNKISRRENTKNNSDEIKKTKKPRKSMKSKTPTKTLKPRRNRKFRPKAQLHRRNRMPKSNAIKSKSNKKFKPKTPNPRKYRQFKSKGFPRKKERKHPKNVILRPSQRLVVGKKNSPGPKQAKCKEVYTLQSNSTLFVYSKKTSTKGNCKHIIKTPSTSNIKIQCPIFDLESGCKTESVVIKSGKDKQTYCSTTDSPDVKTTGGKITITHKYSLSKKKPRKAQTKCSSNKGFACFVTADENNQELRIAEKSNCDTNFLMEPGDTVMLYSRNIGNKAKCKHTFEATEASEFYYSCFFLQFPFQNCKQNYISFTYTDGVDKVKEKYCEETKFLETSQTWNKTQLIKVITKEKKNNDCYGGYACQITSRAADTVFSAKETPQISCATVICPKPKYPSNCYLKQSPKQCCPKVVCSSYIITTQKEWIAGQNGSVCVYSTDPQLGGTFDVNFVNGDVSTTRNIVVPKGSVACVDVPLPDHFESFASPVQVIGKMGEVSVNKTFKVRTFIKSFTFVRTDKPMYTPGQVVNIRIFSMHRLNVDYKQIKQVYIENPAETKIGQWQNVNNTNGIIHLEFILAKEALEGEYKLVVEGPYKNATKTFKVKVYVLPKFEVSIESSDYIPVEGTKLDFKVCAKDANNKSVAGKVEVFLAPLNNLETNETTNGELVNGCMALSLPVPTNEFIIDSNLGLCSIYILNATVTEAGTGVQYDVQKRICKEIKEGIVITMTMNPFLKKNIPFLMKIGSKMDSLPIKNEILEVCDPTGKYCNDFTTDDKGSVSVIALIDEEINFPSFKVNIKSKSYTEEFPFNTLASPTNTFVEVMPYLEPVNLCQGLSINLDVLTNYEGSSIKVSIQVFNNGKILLSKYEDHNPVPGIPNKYTPNLGADATGNSIKSFSVAVDVPPINRNMIWVLVGIHNSAELIIGSTKLSSDTSCIEIPVSLQLALPGENIKPPGDTTTLRLTTEGASVCSIGIVDRSFNGRTELNRMEFTIALYKRSVLLDIFSNQHNCYFRENKEAVDVYDKALVFVWSDSYMATDECEIFAKDGADTKEVAVEDDDLGVHFQETWLWDIKTVPASGVLTEELTVPDTMTDWMGEVVCVHKDKGVGVGVATFTSFKPLKISLTLLPNPKQGETVPVAVSVFNYLNITLPIRVALASDPAFTVVGPSDAIACVSGNDKMSASFSITPNTVGEQNVTVTATVDNSASVDSACNGADQRVVYRSDSVKRSMNIKYKGITIVTTWSAMVCSPNPVVWNITAPANPVEGSVRFYVSLSGSMMTLHLHGLLNKPHDLAPIIYVRRYLEASGELTDAMKNKTTTYMNIGYQKELTYQRSDGSYSAFGDSDDEGSLWLSVSVYKSFIQARKYINVDEKNLKTTKKWILSQIKSDGCFKQIGMAHPKSMKGGLANNEDPRTLTGYVLAALYGAGDTHTPDEEVILTKAADCVVKGGDPSDTYSSSIRAYALVLYKHSTADAAVQFAYNKVILDNTLYASLLVESLAYVLLALLSQSTIDEGKVIIIVKKINEHRDENGYPSAQATARALEALAVYEEKLAASKRDSDLTVNVKYSSVSKNITINKQNNLLEQQTPIVKEQFTNVTLKATGTGCAIAVGIMQFNSLAGDASRALGLSASFKTLSVDKAQLTVCVSYLLEDGESNMMVLEISLITGYAPNTTSLQSVKATTPVVKRVESKDNEINIYYNPLKTGQETCISFMALAEVSVLNAEPGIVIFYDYFAPHNSISQVISDVKLI